jgi:diguanylate cyclase (GGDEF)-like protein
MTRLGRRSLATLLFPVIMLVLGMTAAATIASLQNRADTSLRAQVQIASFRFTLQALLNAAFSASPQSGGSPTTARSLISGDEGTIGQDVGQLAKTSPPSALEGIHAGLMSLYPVINEIYEIGAYGGGYNGAQSATINRLQSTMLGDAALVDGRLVATAAVYDRRATSAKRWATDGETLAILILLLAFGFFYFRSVRARGAAEVFAAENNRLLSQSRHDAHTDALTGLPNRRALIEDLATQLDGEPDQLTLGLFDLDGFKAYNDTFGHVAGDALLDRLSTKLAAAFKPGGKAYRIGGDEFCVLARNAREAVATLGASALSESGAGWVIGSSAGTVSVRTESQSPEDALDIADQRMYADKASRKDPQQLGARVRSDAEFTARAARVERLAGRTALALGLDDHSVAVICAAASMYNAGLRSVPSSIVENPGGLDHDEWAFVRRHPIVGERMVANERLTEAASLVRSTQERADGDGYPDGLRGEEIPLGSRIIAVCSAFVAMTASRPYAPAMTIEDAVLELAGNAGTQFDGDVVTAFSESLKTERVP